jgi:protein-disulfide isomerase
MEHKELLKLFIPAIIIVLLGLGIRVIQYQPLYPKKQSEKKNASTVIPILPNDPITGSKKAGISIIAFEDFGCEGCKAQSSMFEQLQQKYPNKIKIVWKLLNVTKFPVASEKGHAYGFCAYEQGKFAEFKEMAFANGSNLSDGILSIIADNVKLNQKKLNACLQSGRADAYATQTEAFARMLNVQAVPTLFMNNKQMQTPQSLQEWEAVLAL